VVGPVFPALTLTIAVSPLYRVLDARGLPRWCATVVALVAVYAIIVGLAGSFAYAVAKLAGILPAYQDEFTDLLRAVRSALGAVGIGEAELDAAVAGLDLGALVGVLYDWLSGLLEGLLELVSIVMTLFFMVLDAGQFPRKLRLRAPTRPAIATALSGMARDSQRYLLVATAFGLIVAAFDVAILYWLAIPFPLVWGVPSFITNYIPNVGFIIGLIPPALPGLLDKGPSMMVAVIVAYSVVNFVVQSIIQPKVSAMSSISRRR
jgi:AI-2 transport protein TqsA